MLIRQPEREVVSGMGASPIIASRQPARFVQIAGNTATPRRCYTTNVSATFCARRSRPALLGRERGFAATSFSFAHIADAPSGIAGHYIPRYPNRTT